MKKSAEWQATFDNFLCEGLDKDRVYVRLARVKTDYATMVIAFRPVLARAAKEGVFFGGKLSVFFESTNFKPINEDVAMEWLQQAVPNMDFNKRSGQRLGVNILAPVKAPLTAGTEFLTMMHEKGLVPHIMSFVEERTNVKIEAPECVEGAITAAYRLMAEDAFTDLTPNKGDKEGTLLKFPPAKHLH